MMAYKLNNNTITSPDKAKHGKLAFIVCLLLALSGCASSPKNAEIPSLKREQSRVEFEKPNRIPSLIRERWFGKVVRVKNKDKDIVFDSFANPKESPISRWVDLEPGEYEVTAQCRPHQAFQGVQSLALASLKVRLTAGNALSLACRIDKSEYEQGASVDKKGSAKKREYSVRLVELD